jgi:hypothetical protein
MGTQRVANGAKPVLQREMVAIAGDRLFASAITVVL